MKANCDQMWVEKVETDENWQKIDYCPDLAIRGQIGDIVYSIRPFRRKWYKSSSYKEFRRRLKNRKEGELIFPCRMSNVHS